MSLMRDNVLNDRGEYLVNLLLNKIRLKSLGQSLKSGIVPDIWLLFALKNSNAAKFVNFEGNPVIWLL